MNILTILGWLKDLLRIPAIGDEAAVRAWLTKLVDFSKFITAQIPGEVDDKAAALLAAVIANEETWAEFYVLLVDILDGNDLPQAAPTALMAGGFDWELILKIIELIKEIWDLFNQGKV